MTEQAFWQSVDRHPTGCWIWQKCLVRGYGVARFENRRQQAHRIAYKLTQNAIPAGLQVCHQCDNPSCVRPSHLFIGTRSDNMRDMLSKDRANRPRGERINTAKLTSQEVLEIRALYNSGTITQTALGKRFGISQYAVSCIVRLRHWKHF
jgi:hypothetical protein